jgi:hypothetical protein
MHFSFHFYYSKILPLFSGTIIWELSSHRHKKSWMEWECQLWWKLNWCWCRLIKNKKWKMKISTSTCMQHWYLNILLFIFVEQFDYRIMPMHSQKHKKQFHFTLTRIQSWSDRHGIESQWKQNEIDILMKIDANIVWFTHKYYFACNISMSAYLSHFLFSMHMSAHILDMNAPNAVYSEKNE